MISACAEEHGGNCGEGPVWPPGGGREVLRHKVHSRIYIITLCDNCFGDWRQDFLYSGYHGDETLTLDGFRRRHRSLGHDDRAFRFARIFPSLFLLNSIISCSVCFCWVLYILLFSQHTVVYCLCNLSGSLKLLTLDVKKLLDIA